MTNFANYLTVLLGAAGGLLALVWLALVVWAYRDVRTRSRSTVAAVLTILLVALLPVVGLVVYLLLRPRETLAAAYEITGSLAVVVLMHALFNLASLGLLTLGGQ